MRPVFLATGLSIALTFGIGAFAQQGTGAPSQTAPASGQTDANSQSSNDVPSPDTQANSDTAAQGSASPNTSQDQNTDQQAAKKSRGQRAKDHLKKQMSSWCVGAPVNHCYEKQPGDDSNKDTQAQTPRPPRSDDTAAAPPMTPGESSSKDTKVDLTPPPGEEVDHPDVAENSDTGEFHQWDPHRAMKNVEVGDFYFKQGNYRAAVSRYQEALEWKPRDAEATYKLADAYDKMGNKVAARKQYEAYLSILPKGPYADDAKKALARLEDVKAK